MKKTVLAILGFLVLALPGTAQTRYWNLNSERLQLPVLTPVNAAAATATLTFSGVVADGQKVVIGTDKYEFDTNSSATSGYTAVDVSGGATAPDAVTALVAAITANSSSLVTAVDGAGDTVVVTAVTAGAAANSYATTETCTNGAWGGATMSGGVNATACRAKDIAADASYLYVCTATSSAVTHTNWRRVSLGSAF